MAAVDCTDVRMRLQPFLDSALNTEESEGVEAHVAECDSCWQALTAMRESDPGLEMDLNRLKYEPAPLPNEFTDLVMQRIHDERPKGVNLIWPWLRQKWTRKQYASAAYAMSATLVVVSAGNLLFLWNESTSLLTAWSIRLQAYWEAGGAYLGATVGFLGSLWQGLLSLLNLA